MLLPALVAHHGRVVTVSSSLHTHIKTLDVALLAESQRTGEPVGYETTKLLNVLFVTALAAGHGAGVIASAADPGFVHTNPGRNASRAFRIFLAATRPIQAAPDAAALTLVHAATSPDVTTSGGYYAKRKPARPSALAQDSLVAEDLWSTSAALLTAKGYPVHPGPGLSGRSSP